MRSIKAEKIIGIKVWKDNVNYAVSRGFILDEKVERKHSLLEFESIEELKSFINRLKELSENIR